MNSPKISFHSTPGFVHAGEYCRIHDYSCLKYHKFSYLDLDIIIFYNQPFCSFDQTTFINKIDPKQPFCPFYNQWQINITFKFPKPEKGFCHQKIQLIIRNFLYLKLVCYKFTYELTLICTLTYLKYTALLTTPQI